MILFGKKYRAKLKKELKKEILAEVKKEEAKKQEKETNKKKPPLPVNNSKEDLEIIRQKLFYAAIFVICLIVLMIVYLFFGSSISFSKNPGSNQVVTKPKDKMYWEIEKFPNGNIPLNNIYINDYIDEIEIDYGPYPVYDINAIYEKSTPLIANLDVAQQLYLLGKTNSFDNYISNLGFDNRHQICYQEGVIEIESSRIADMFQKEFDINLLENRDFYYEYYQNESFIVAIDFVYKNGKYYSNCISIDEETNVISKRIENRVMSIEKSDDFLFFNVNVMFRSKNKYYRDYLLTDMIENPSAMVDMDYLLFGSKWQYIYKLNEQNRYYLYSITNVNYQ